MTAEEKEIFEESVEGNGVDYEEELKKSKKLEMKLRKGNEMLCIECDNLERKFICVEVLCEELVEKLKNKVCSVVWMTQEEAHLEVEDTREEIDNEFSLDAREQCLKKAKKRKKENKR